MEEAGGGLEERLMTLREFTTRHLLADRSDDADSTARGTGIHSAEQVLYLATHLTSICILRSRYLSTHLTVIFLRV